MSTSAGKRKAEDLEDDHTPTDVNKKQRVDETESENDEVESGNEGGDSEDDIDEDELAYLYEDQVEHGHGAPPGRRTRGVKIDFTGKDVGSDDEDEDEEKEPEAPIEGKGKGKAVPTTPGQGPPAKPLSSAKPLSTAKPPSTVKPASTASSKDA